MKKNSNMNLIGFAVLMIVIIGGFFLLRNPGSAAADSQLTLTTQPAAAQVGNNTVMITVHDASGKEVDDAKVNVDVNMTTMNMGTQQGTATSQGNGQYAANTRFSMRGPWRISATATYADGKQAKKDFVVNVQ